MGALSLVFLRLLSSHKLILPFLCLAASGDQKIGKGEYERRHETETVDNFPKNHKVNDRSTRYRIVLISFFYIFLFYIWIQLAARHRRERYERNR